MAENRIKARHRTLKAGKIVFNRQTSIVDCTVRNLSDTGACLLAPSTYGIPDSFDLLLEPEKRNRRCRVAWRTDTRIGVSFL